MAGRSYSRRIPFGLSCFFYYFAGVMARMFLLFLPMLMAVAQARAQDNVRAKMSPYVRHAAGLYKYDSHAAKGARVSVPALTAFVKVEADGGAQALEDNGCRILARYGDIYIASIPANRIASLASSTSVERIEAGRSCSALMDTTAIIIDALPAYGGEGLPQAYTGEGVVVGVQDIGFDVTHPNFYDASMSEYRVKRFWDQLSADTAGGSMYVGAEYTDEESILAYAHSRDGYVETHGTHTLGSAAGSGYDSAYRGIAYGSDICIVSNAVTSDTVFIAEEDLYKYTTATDALGFKYIFDYASEAGKPCVISFSEGSHQGFSDEEMLYYEVLDSMVGPGRIIVASAGNEGEYKTYIHKEPGTESAGTFIRSYDKYAYMRMVGDTPFDIRLKFYGDEGTETVEMNTEDVLAASPTGAEYALGYDAVYADTVLSGGRTFNIEVCGYASAFDESLTAYELYVEGTESIGQSVPMSVEVVGGEADVEIYRGTGYFIENDCDATLDDGEYTHSIYSPGSAPAVICVGATSYRTGNTNAYGDITGSSYGTDGCVATYSSVGPTFDGRVKPEVVAPGSNIISSASSYFIEENSDDEGYMAIMISFFTHGGRTYAWFNNTGTSMSTPVVAGTVALWLQADPTLTPDDIRDVLEQTCVTRDTSLEYPNNYYGHGEIDAYKGLLYILGLTGIGGISASQPAAARIALTGDGRLTITFDETPEQPFTVSVYTTGGVLVMRRSVENASSGTQVIDVSSLPAGVYAVQLCGGGKGVPGSTLVRKGP